MLTLLSLVAVHPTAVAFAGNICMHHPHLRPQHHYQEHPSLPASAAASAVTESSVISSSKTPSSPGFGRHEAPFRAHALPKDPSADLDLRAPFGNLDIDELDESQGSSPPSSRSSHLLTPRFDGTSPSLSTASTLFSPPPSDSYHDRPFDLDPAAHGVDGFNANEMGGVTLHERRYGPRYRGKAISTSAPAFGAIGTLPPHSADTMASGGSGQLLYSSRRACSG
jgi:hypothetical protein